jgi:hypothetical protein
MIVLLSSLVGSKIHIFSTTTTPRLTSTPSSSSSLLFKVELSYFWIVWRKNRIVRTIFKILRGFFLFMFSEWQQPFGGLFSESLARC